MSASVQEKHVLKGTQELSRATPSHTTTPGIQATGTSIDNANLEQQSSKRGHDDTEEWQKVGKRGKTTPGIATFPDSGDSGVIQAGQCLTVVGDDDGEDMVTQDSSVFEGDGPFDLDKV